MLHFEKNQNHQYDDHAHSDDHDDENIDYHDDHQVGAWKGKQVPGESVVYHNDNDKCSAHDNEGENCDYMAESTFSKVINKN